MSHDRAHGKASRQRKRQTDASRNEARPRYADSHENQRAELWVAQAAAAATPDVSDFEKGLEAFPTVMAAEQLRRMMKVDDRGDQEMAVARNRKALEKARKAHSTGRVRSDFHSPDLVVAGVGCPEARAKAKAGRLRPRQVFHTRGKVGYNQAFSLTEQRAMLEFWGVTEKLRVEESVSDGEAPRVEGLPTMEQRERGGAAEYVESMRPKQAAGGEPPRWLSRLSAQVEAGDNFWS